ncbi:MAG: PH domain-containing protein [Propionibacteriaceae bacterium]|jgi:uncharacterized membrane protein YdbT with pleckstrin-like domain|nr:PH domain-containing protein [Propionibacteriaceae bacterium]
MRVSQRHSLWSPHVERFLLVDEGEEIVDEVAKHPITMIWPLTKVFFGVVLVFSSIVVGSFWLFFILAGLVLIGWGFYEYHDTDMDRFVVTNMRVFRVHGVFDRSVATIPLARILDISVKQNPLGMLFHYGTLTFESAAADQGLHKITYVSHPNDRDLTIQSVIQRAGLRAVAQKNDPNEEEGT